MFQHSSPGGTLVAIFDPTTGIIRPVHRAYLCHAHSGEIPLFESHFQRWNISLSEHHSQAPPCIEQTVELPATWNRSLFGPLRGDIKRSIHVFHLFQQSSFKPSTPVVKPVRSLRRSPATPSSTSDPPPAAQRSF